MEKSQYRDCWKKGRHNHACGTSEHMETERIIVVTSIVRVRALRGRQLYSGKENLRHVHTLNLECTRWNTWRNGPQSQRVKGSAYHTDPESRTRSFCSAIYLPLSSRIAQIVFSGCANHLPPNSSLLAKLFRSLMSIWSASGSSYSAFCSSKSRSL